MNKVVRDFFVTLRENRHLTQTQVATRGRIKQSTISKIEIEPEYEPSVSVFVKALEGLGVTASAFFAHIEGLKPDDVPVDDLATVEHDDEADLALFDSEDQIAARVIRLLTRLAIKGSEKERGEDRGLHPKARPPAPPRRPSDRPRRRRTLPKPKEDQPPEG